MLTISSKQQLDRYKRQRALITLFLDSGYTQRNIEVVMNAKWGFDAHVGRAWHMLIPYKEGGYAIDVPLTKRSYGIHLSRQVIKEQGIGTAELPVILFENYTQESDYFYVSLSGMSEEEVITIMGEIGDIVVNEFENGRTDPADFRFDVTEKVKRHVRIQRAVKLVKRGASTAIGVAVGLFG
ncbi:hypothetical protein [Nitratireductor pacificus]|uniref:Uncharacterized protein n=1 Tax=Nitratireductor pacificus pht-3B TaxID=391937 RepID=K2MDH4_9HYPH|nr:hypothetical protein [Nitratireductor pacificus]EKF18840.1 hypothetical protein NA2_11670 [Nitratireductor pacificus pht-3B]